MNVVFPEGHILDDTYRLIRMIGQGGMGTVYEATHARLAGRYAVKVLLQKVSESPGGLARFQREAQITSLLRHPHIVQVVDYNTASTSDMRPSARDRGTFSPKEFSPVFVPPARVDQCVPARGRSSRVPSTCGA